MPQRQKTENGLVRPQQLQWQPNELQTQAEPVKQTLKWDQPDKQTLKWDQLDKQTLKWDQLDKQTLKWDQLDKQTPKCNK